MHVNISVDHQYIYTRACVHVWMFSPFLIGRTFASPNIVRSIRRTSLRFLTELIVRQTWLGQFDELYFVLNWLVMGCKLRPELAAEA